MPRIFSLWLLAFLLLGTEVHANSVCFNSASTSPWTVDATWNNANNRIEAIGGGGDGFTGCSSNVGGCGGGGSAGYTFATNQTLTGGASVAFQVGLHGGVSSSTAASWFCNATTNCTSPATSAVLVSAKGGTTAAGTAGGNGAVNTSIVGTGTIGQGGGTGSTTHGGGGGGGAAGPSGTGAAGVNGTVSGGGAGGQGDNATGGAGGAGGLAGAPAVAGSAGSEIDASCPLAQGGTVVVGAGGGGGGGALSTNLSAANGGAFGAGGGGAGPLGSIGTGTNGIVRLTWTPAASTGPASRRTLMGVGK